MAFEAFSPKVKRWRALLGIVAASLAGCGASRTETTTVTSVQTVTTTVVRVHTLRPRTVTATASAPTSTTVVQGSGHIYSGNGTENLGTITVNAPSTIEWACPNCAAFAISSDLSGGHIMALSSTATSGRSAVDPGMYANVMVVGGPGDWAFRIVPQ